MLRFATALLAALALLLASGLATAPAGAQAPGWSEDGQELTPLPEDVFDDPADTLDDPADALPDDPTDPLDDGLDDEPDVPLAPPLPTTTKRFVKGKVAMLRTDGKAAIPRNAPKRVRAIIASANRIIGKPYKWGGGHGRLRDSGYDCSGAVSFSLMRAGVQRSVMVSGQLARAFAGGAGRYVTVYGHSKHVYMEVAGLRLDTSPYGDQTRRSGVRWRPVVGARAGFKVRHPVGL
jgi:hypothetical protein